MLTIHPPGSSLTIRKVLLHLLPNGTRGEAGNLTEVPLWPLDLFGVAAYLVQQTDCHTRLLEYHDTGIGTQFAQARANLVRAGATWRVESNIDSADNRRDFVWLDHIHRNWATLLRWSDCLIEKCSEVDEIVLALLSLVAIADEASLLVGYFSGDDPQSGDANDTAKLWIPRVFDYATNDVDRDALKPIAGDWYSKLNLQQLALIEPVEPLPSGCLVVPFDRLCVLPKSHTPALGCTLRSLTHNLALHVSATQVRSSWYNYKRYSHYEVGNSLNILIVPFPYQISPNDFEGRDLHDSNYRGFTLRQSWLDRQSIEFAQMISQMIKRCERENTLPDIIVFPEAALNEASHSAILEALMGIQNRLGERLQHLIVIAGLSDATDHHHRNYSLTAYLSRGVTILKTGQKKHHRWKLDKDQINTYSLGGSLSPEFSWWELADVEARTVDYHVFGNGQNISVLICEDLARTDPVKPSINATAPNLVFALLMDGPQLSSRWPGRYALGIADDPGSAVLTITSLGLIERSNWRHNNARQTVALWGGIGGVRELDLPADKEALLLTIVKETKERYSLDGRRSVTDAVGWSFGGLKAI